MDKNPLLNPRKLVSLWDMQNYPTDKIVHVLAAVASVKESAVHHRAMGGPWPFEERSKICKIVRSILPLLEELGLTAATALCDELLSGVYTTWNVDHAEQAANSIRVVIEAELKRRSFFVISPERLRYYDGAELAGKKFKSDWPHGSDELDEAGKCFALSRYTACACHLMRAMEHALRSFEDALKIQHQSRSNWGDILRGIEEKKGRKGDSRPPAILPIQPSIEWNTNPDFYEGCYTFICGVKTSCRDKVFHVESSYNEEQAVRLFASVTSFLSHAADQLSEIP